MSRSVKTTCWRLGSRPRTEATWARILAATSCPTPLDCALWGLHNNRVDDGDYIRTVQALVAAGAPTRYSEPTGDKSIDTLLAAHRGA